MNILSLFSGIGGLDLGIKVAVSEARTLLYVENNGYCQRVLHSRMLDGSLDPAPLFGDITVFDGRPWRGSVDLVCGGFPCQPVSLAGQRKGQDDERWLWPDFARVVDEVRPGLVFAENVPGLLVRGLADVVRDLAHLGYDSRWLCLSAADVGAPHLRKRLFLLAHARHDEPPTWIRCKEGQQRGGGREARGKPAPPGRTLADTQGQRRELRSAEGERPGRPAGGGGVVGDTERQSLALRGVQRRDMGEECETPLGAGLPLFPPGPGDREQWAALLAERPDLAPAVKSEVRRLADGLPRRVDELRALGNAVCPLQAAAALTELLQRANRGMR